MYVHFTLYSSYAKNNLVCSVGFRDTAGVAWSHTVQYVVLICAEPRERFNLFNLEAVSRFDLTPIGNPTPTPPPNSAIL